MTSDQISHSCVNMIYWCVTVTVTVTFARIKETSTNCSELPMTTLMMSIHCGYHEFVQITRDKYIKCFKPSRKYLQLSSTFISNYTLICNGKTPLSLNSEEQIYFPIAYEVRLCDSIGWFIKYLLVISGCLLWSQLKSMKKGIRKGSVENDDGNSTICHSWVVGAF